MMAIFIAAFLFFLSVALVGTNRQDILLALSVDHRLRASTAARAGANQCLQLMRSHSDWETRLKDGYKGTMGSGASWNVTVKPLSIEQSPPYYLEVQAHGTSGFISSDYRMAVEEIRFADSIAKKGRKPHLFTVNNADVPQLMMLGPSMRWTSLESLGVTAKPNSLCAGGGLFAYMEDGGNEPPQLMDWKPRIITQGFFEPGTFLPAQLRFQQGPKVRALRIVANAISREALPDPNSFVGKVYDATIDGSPEGKPRVEVVPVPNGMLTVDVSRYRGPVVDWYTLLSDRFVGEDDMLYAFATHYLYQGERFQNIIAYEGAFAVNRGTLKPAKMHESLAVLRWDDAAKKWTAFCDPIRLSSPDDDPVIDAGVTPNPSILTVSNGRVFSMSADQEMSPLEVKSNRYDRDGLNLSKQSFLIAYQGRPRVLIDNNILHEGTRIYQIAGIPMPGQSLVSEVPQVNGQILNERGQFDTLAVLPQQKLTWILPSNSSRITVAGDDLFTYAGLRYRSATSLDLQGLATPVVPADYSISVLLHYDGKGWQVFPQGAYAAVWDPLRIKPTPNSVTIEDMDGYKKELVGPLALAGYATPANLMRRYAPLAFPPP